MLIMPIEEKITTWVVLPWESEMSREDLLAVWIRQLQSRIEDIEKATTRMKETRIKNKDRFDKMKRIRPRNVQEGDRVLVYDNSLDNQYSTIWKFAKRWFGPYEVRKITNKATYFLNELDGIEIRIPITGRIIKILKRTESLKPEFYEEGEELKESKEVLDELCITNVQVERGWVT